VRIRKKLAGRRERKKLKTRSPEKSVEYGVNKYLVRIRGKARGALPLMGLWGKAEQPGEIMGRDCERAEDKHKSLKDRRFPGSSWGHL